MDTDAQERVPPDGLTWRAMYPRRPRRVALECGSGRGTPPRDRTRNVGTRFRPHRGLAFRPSICYPVRMSGDSASRSGPSDFDRRHEALLGEVLAAREHRARARRTRTEDRRRAFGDLCEASEGLAVAWLRQGTPVGEMVACADGDVWLLWTLVRWLRLSATRRIDRLRHAARRSAYYERERARRQRLAAVRRTVRKRTTTSPCPTREQVLEAWEGARESNEGLLRFGSLMEDLACYVDSSLVRAGDGTIIARRGGVKAWLQVNVPALSLRYKTVRADKEAARKL